MRNRATSGRAAMRVGLVLFDETHTRVFALRGAKIEDALEYTVDGTVLRRAHAGLQIARRLPAAPQLRERAMHTVRLVTSLHAQCPLRYVLVAGPPWAQALLWQYLPLPFRHRRIGSLDLPVGAGENAIVQAVGPSMRLIARKDRSAKHRATVAAPQRQRPGPARPLMSVIGGGSFRTAPPVIPMLSGAGHALAAARY